ncbi:MAG TPA: hypothetical protein VIQ77_11075 [Mucilaginibacter sp.]
MDQLLSAFGVITAPVGSIIPPATASVSLVVYHLDKLYTISYLSAGHKQNIYGSWILHIDMYIPAI